MKQRVKSIVLIVLSFFMLNYTLILPLHAQEEIVNLYDVNDSMPGIPDVSNIYGEFIEHSSFWGTNIIEVRQGDKIYIAPAYLNQTWTIAAYRSETSGYSISPRDVQTYATLSNGCAVLCWTVPAGVTMMRVAQNIQWKDSTVITKNQPLDATTYEELMKKEAQKSAIKENLFHVAAPGIPSNVNMETEMEVSNAYYTSSPISVAEGDVLYIAPYNMSLNIRYLTTFDRNGNGISCSTAVEQIQRFSNGQSVDIVKYTVPAGVAYICMITPNQYAKTTVVTKNTPFTEKDYHNYVSGIDFNASTPVDEDSVMRGKTALFIGDSINAGAYDVASPSTGKGFAGRLALSTGLKVTNKAIGGSSLAKSGGRPWIPDQLNIPGEQNFDLIVIFGGINDIRENRPVGTVPQTPSSQIHSYAGALQYLISLAQEKYPNAEIFYISCFPLPGHHTGGTDDMTEYVAIADAVCLERKVNHIDLYNNTELTEKIQPHTIQYFPDLLHPTSEGYDLITPYVQSAIEKVMRDKLNEDQPGDTTPEEPGDTTPEEPGDTSTEAPGDTTTEEPGDTTESTTGSTTGTTATASNEPNTTGGCTSKMVSGLGMTLMSVVASVFFFKRKRKIQGDAH